MMSYVKLVMDLLKLKFNVLDVGLGYNFTRFTLFSDKLKVAVEEESLMVVLVNDPSI